MNTFIGTLIAATVIVLAGLCLLSISWLLTGKSRLKPGACGRNPTIKDDLCDTNISCQLCEKKCPHEEAEK